MPVPTTAQLKAMWQAVLKAYWAWTKSKYTSMEKEILLERVRTQIKTRLMELSKKTVTRKVHKIRNQIGHRFLHNPKVTSAGRPAGT